MSDGEEDWIHGRLQVESAITNCQGIPKYLAFLADKLKDNFLNEVSVQQYVQIPQNQMEKAR